MLVLGNSTAWLLCNGGRKREILEHLSHTLIPNDERSRQETNTFSNFNQGTTKLVPGGTQVV